jgi:drug/metabolite transporter (DMT)-like permease
MHFLEPAEATAIYNTAPFFALLFGYALLHETLPPLTVGAELMR